MFRGAFVKMASVARHGVGSCARRASAASVGKANHTWDQQSLGQWTCCFWIHKWRFLRENNRTKWRMFIAMFDYQRVFLNVLKSVPFTKSLVPSEHRLGRAVCEMLQYPLRTLSLLVDGRMRPQDLMEYIEMINSGFFWWNHHLAPPNMRM